MVSINRKDGTTELTGNDSFPSVQRKKGHTSQVFDQIHVSNSCLIVCLVSDDPRQHSCLTDHDTICTKHTTDIQQRVIADRNNTHL